MTHRPLVALTSAFSAGILLATFALPLVLLCLVALVFSVLLFIFTRRPLWTQLSLLLAFGLLGSASYINASLRDPKDISNLTSRLIRVTGVVQSEVNTKESTERLRGTVQFTLAARRASLSEGSYIDVMGNMQASVPLVMADENTSVVQKKKAENPLHYGDVVTIYGRLERPAGQRNPGGFDYRAYLERRGIYATLTAKRPDEWQIVEGQGASGNPVMRLASILRAKILHHALRSLPKREADVLNGILLGERTDLPNALRDDFERTGTTHILATAGLHVGIVVLLLLTGLRFLRIANRPAHFVAFSLLILFALMAGGRPSVVRAIVIACVYLLGTLLEREPNLANALALAALILLIGNPYNLYDPGFQMSFATVITIVLLMPYATSAIKRIESTVRGDWPGVIAVKRGVETMVACFFLALAAQLGALPLLAYYFNEISLVSVLANTLVVPILFLIIPLGFSAAALGLVLPALAWSLDRLLDFLLHYVLWIVQTCSAPTYASISVESPSVSVIIGYYALLWTFAWRFRPGRKEEGAKGT